jgi:hypothetical protein
MGRDCASERRSNRAGRGRLVARRKVIHVRFSFNLPVCWGLVWRKP